MTTILFVGLLLSIILVCTICTIIDYCEWKEGFNEYYPKISFKTFKTMYEINPSAFQKYGSCIKYNGDYVEFTSYRDMKKYQRYSRIENKNNKKEASDKATIQMLESFQEDIDNYKKQNESEIKKYSDAIIKQVKESTERYEKLKRQQVDHFGNNTINAIYKFSKRSVNAETGEVILEEKYFLSEKDEINWINKMKNDGWSFIHKIIR